MENAIATSRYVLYGAGKVGRAFLHLIGPSCVSCFIDKDESLTSVEGIPVVRSVFSERAKNTAIIVTTTNYIFVAEIICELEKEGIPYLLAADFLRKSSLGRYIFFGIDDLRYHDLSTYRKMVGEENILCCSDVWNPNLSIKDIKYPFLEADELQLLIMDQIVQDIEIVIVTKYLPHVMNCVRYLEKYRLRYCFVDDIAKQNIEKDAETYSRLNTRETFAYTPEMRSLCLYDKYMKAGRVSNYLWQDLWGARKIYERRPIEHYDIGSRLDGFITHLLSFGQKVKMLDIRPLEQHIANLDFVHTDATHLKEIEDESIESLSALCSLEHFGLGRYGDSIDPEAVFKCFSAIQKRMKKGGHLYISVPVGNEHLEFNGVRVFFAKTVIDSFPKMKLLEFSVCTHDSFEKNVPISRYDNVKDDIKGGERFGLFEFEK